MKHLLVLLLLFFFRLELVYAQQEEPLYQSAIPNSKPIKNREKSELGKDGILRISKVTIPAFTVYQPKPGKGNGTAVIICPGGAYTLLAAGHEGTDVAKALTEWGITAVVLKYRLPDDSTMIDKSIGPLQDVQQAIQLLRLNAEQYRINPNRVGLMGFSAGGHLAATAGTHFSKAVLPSHFKTISLRPNFLVLAYPVISCTDSLTHISSRKKLLGDKPTKEQIINFSNELQVTNQTPPAFLVHAKDDAVVKPANSLLFHEALKKNKVASEIYWFEHGGHGFGMNNKDTNDRWMDALKTWMDSMGWLKR
jgi:acetyl esterase/lipase